MQALIIKNSKNQFKMQVASFNLKVVDRTTEKKLIASSNNKVIETSNKKLKKKKKKDTSCDS